MDSRRAYAVDGLDNEVSLMVVDGVEGPSLYVNDYRVAGPKPWGGGTRRSEWKAPIRDVLVALVGDPDVSDDELRRLAREDALGFHRESRRRKTPALIERLRLLGEEPHGR